MIILKCFNYYHGKKYIDAVFIFCNFILLMLFLFFVKVNCILKNRLKYFLQREVKVYCWIGWIGQLVYKIWSFDPVHLYTCIALFSNWTDHILQKQLIRRSCYFFKDSVDTMKDAKT